MKYMLLIYSDERAWTKDQWIACIEESTDLCKELAAAGQFVDAAPLQPVATATSVRVCEGERLVTAGPFAETTEQLGGYFLIDVPNLDLAIALAARIPSAKKGAVEIRPVLEVDGLPTRKSPNPEDTRPTRMLICYHDQPDAAVAESACTDTAMAEAIKITHELDARGQYLDAAPLHPAAMATCVRLRDGRRIVTDGPFTEMREVVGGFYLIRDTSLDEAIGVAARHCEVSRGTVEIRAVHTLPGMPRSQEREAVSSYAAAGRP